MSHEAGVISPCEGETRAKRARGSLTRHLQLKFATHEPLCGQTGITQFGSK
jgi:hypothetical protein